MLGLMLALRHQRCPAEGAPAGLHSGELPDHVGDVGSNGGMVANPTARAAFQDWRDAGAGPPSSLRRLPILRGRVTTRGVRRRACSHQRSARNAERDDVGIVGLRVGQSTGWVDDGTGGFCSHARRREYRLRGLFGGRAASLASPVRWMRQRLARRVVGGSTERSDKASA